MNPYPPIIAFLIAYLSIINCLMLGSAQKLRPTPFLVQSLSKPEQAALELIRRQKYDEAINRLEQVLESGPANREALTYLTTANLYRDLQFTKAKKEFDEAFRAGGGATFFVTHSHEKLDTNDIVEYCRGWLHLRKDGVEFVPEDSTHGFKLRYNEVIEFKQNRFSKKTFHIKVGEKNQNFRGRTATELEPLLIVALYKTFAAS